MTPYILILLYILNPLNFQDLILDRVIDTAIGSVIALLANLLFSPEWTYRQFAEYLQQMLDANKNYFLDVSSFFTGKQVTVNQYKLSRKNAYVALANISDALNRMSSEPKSKQLHVSEYHELVVLNYMMATHIATLATMALGKTKPNTDPEYQSIVHAVTSNLDLAIKELKTAGDHFPLSFDTVSQKIPAQISSGIFDSANELVTENRAEPVTETMDKNKAELEGRLAGDGLKKLNQRMTDMVEMQKKELAGGMNQDHLPTSLAGVKVINDQFNFIWKISEELLKMLRA